MNPVEIEINGSNKKYNILKISHGEAIGYTDTDLTYAGKLIANVNETVESILSKLKTMLDNYEYFYDEEGHFIFQKRQDYVSNQFSTVSIDGLGIEYQQASSARYVPPIDIKDVVSIAQNPQFQNIKNDFSIWGTRSGESGSLPFHSRIAIHRKPLQYCTYSNLTWKVGDIRDSFMEDKIELEGDIATTVKTTKDEMQMDRENPINVYGGSLLKEYPQVYKEFLNDITTKPDESNIESFIF